MSRTEAKPTGSINAAFGTKNRARLIAEYFEKAPPGRPPWEHFYRVLLWIDRVNGLAHCYESDKSQPGKPWYGRSLAFHDWLARAMDVAPLDLAGEIDWMFRRATQDLAARVLDRAERASRSGESERQKFAGQVMPVPGEDPELISIIEEVLAGYLLGDLSIELQRTVVQRIRQHMAVEKKRANLLGEGFEDMIVGTVMRTCRREGLTATARARLHDLPGFNRARAGDKDNKVDVAILRGDRGLRTLVTAKWSIRSDREKQFPVDFEDYNNAESFRTPFEYVVVTNEFDPARLTRACEQMVRNSFMFSQVVHINLEALRATYDWERHDTMERVVGHIDSGRLIGLDSWLEHIAST